MGLAEQKLKDQSRAAYMKKRPNQFPDSVMRPHNGCGSDMRKLADKMGMTYIGQSRSSWERGMLGGILYARALGLPEPEFK